jgi:DNA-binding MarR family transcriptional regulator
MTINEYPGITTTRLAHLASIDKGTLTRVLDSMAETNLLRRVREQADTRAVSVYISKAGRALLERTVPWANETQARIVEGLSAADINALRRILNHMHANLDKARPKAKRASSIKV